jgi:hypothetical protein
MIKIFVPPKITSRAPKKSQFCHLITADPLLIRSESNVRCGATARLLIGEKKWANAYQ